MKNFLVYLCEIPTIDHSKKMIEFLLKKSDVISYYVKDITKTTNSNNSITWIDKKHITKDFMYSKMSDSMRNVLYYMEEDTIKKHSQKGYFDTQTPSIYEISVVALTEKTRNYLKNMEYHIFDWRMNTLPDDLCFFKEGNCMFSCIAHEKLCWVYLESLEEKQQLENLGITLWQDYEKKTHYLEYSL